MISNFKLKSYALTKFANYALLINDFVKSNPCISEEELNATCLYFAKKCSLTVSEKVKRNADLLRIGGRDE
jgi:hypothetical protein